MNELIEKITEELLQAAIAAGKGNIKNFAFHWERSQNLETELLGRAHTAIREEAERGA